MRKNKVANGTSFPSKSDVIAALKDGEKLSGFKQHILVIEYKRINHHLGVIIGELQENGRTILRGKVTQSPSSSQNTFDWNIIPDGKSFFTAFALDSKEETLIETLRQGLDQSLKEGRL